MSRSRAAILPPRTLEIVRLLCQGKRSDEIADILGISPHTVTYHFRRAFAGYGVTRVTQLAALAALDGLVDRATVTGGVSGDHDALR
jgi:DNA-binding CsgD family transcriptional regulator